MDIIGDLLPIAIFIFAMVMKRSKKVSDQNKGIKKEKKTNRFPKIEELNRMGDILRTKMIPPKSEVNEIMEEVVVQKKPDEITMNPIAQEERDSEDNRGIICESEIGRDYVSFDRKSIRRGMIMSEVLGKPKSLRR